MPGVDFAAAIREGNRDNGLGTIQGRGRGNQTVKDTSDITGGENKGEKFFFMTPQGEIYGFVAPNGDVIQTANYEYTMNYKGAGEFDIIEYHPIDNNLKDKVYDKNRRSSGVYDRLSLRDELAEGECDSDSYHVTKSEADEYNAGLDKETRQGESQQVTSNASSKEHQRRSTRLSRYHKDNVSWIRK